MGGLLVAVLIIALVVALDALCLHPGNVDGIPIEEEML